MALKSLILNGLMSIFSLNMAVVISMKSGTPEFGAWKFRILMFPWLIVLLIKMKCPSLSPLIRFSLESILSDIRIMRLACYLIGLKYFHHLFTLR